MPRPYLSKSLVERDAKKAKQILIERHVHHVEAIARETNPMKVLAHAMCSNALADFAKDIALIPPVEQREMRQVAHENATSRIAELQHGNQSKSSQRKPQLARRA